MDNLEQVIIKLILYFVVWHMALVSASRVYHLGRVVINRLPYCRVPSEFGACNQRGVRQTKTVHVEIHIFDNGFQT